MVYLALNGTAISHINISSIKQYLIEMAIQAHTQTHTSYECCELNSVLIKKTHAVKI